ncbi:CPBP family glutamic-type intramembrane protease [Campylobacter majalis]|uniref:CPBP family glutamic-type intramembrane protease n=1 Tax=Campylobacter majalis TaxID=2790656 RepID=UPI003D69447C
MKLKFLNTYDIIILAIIMFATAIYQSTYAFFTDFDSTQDVLFGVNLDTITGGEYRLMIEEILFALLAFLYLKFRNFDFSQWQFKITLKDSLIALVMFCSAALIMDIFLYVAELVTPTQQQEYDIANYSLPININIELILVSIINASFEELFFIAICMSVSSEKIRKILLFSLIVRISFHTYQGIYSALGIGLILGIFYFVIYQKGYKNLYGFFLSHALADIFGLGLVNFLYFEFQ